MPVSPLLFSKKNARKLPFCSSGEAYLLQDSFLWVRTPGLHIFLWVLGFILACSFSLRFPRLPSAQLEAALPWMQLHCSSGHLPFGFSLGSESFPKQTRLSQGSRSPPLCISPSWPQSPSWMVLGRNHPIGKQLSKSSYIREVVCKVMSSGKA